MDEAALKVDKAAEKVAHFRLDKLAVRKVLFEEREVTAADEGESRPSRVGFHMDCQSGIQSGRDEATDEWRAIVTLSVTLEPDQKWQPYHIEIVIAGAFAGIHMDGEHFDRFCRVAVPTILFPYVRQLVHSVTTDGNFGGVRIDPVNIAELAAKAQFTEEPSPSSGSEPPSSQSPSAAPE